MKAYELFREYEKASKEEEIALNTWSQHDKQDPFSKTTLEAFRNFSRAADRRNEAFDAWMKAIKEE